MDEPLETIEYKGYTIEVYPDNDPIDPLEMSDFLGTMTFWHSRYNLGHEHKFSDVNAWLQRLATDSGMDYDKADSATDEQLWKYAGRFNLIIPVYAYEHGGITIHAGNRPYPFNDVWDSGQLGYIWVSYPKLRKEYKIAHITKSILNKATQCLLSEIREYNGYLTGEIYGYKVLDADGEETDFSCWGFGDKKYMIDEAKSQIDYDIKEKHEQAFLSDAYLIPQE